MNILVIYAHPSEKSFNAVIKNALETAAINAGHDVHVRDLYQLNFNPVLSLAELRGAVPDDVVTEQNFIRQADMLVFVYPLWWAGMPAIMHGYMDRIFSYGFAYKANSDGTTLGLFNDKRVVLVNTIGCSADEYRENGMFQALETIGNRGIFNFCGTEVERFFHFAGIPGYTSEEERDIMVTELTNYFTTLN